jgi:hypothetical protein
MEQVKSKVVSYVITWFGSNNTTIGEFLGRTETSSPWSDLLFWSLRILIADLFVVIMSWHGLSRLNERIPVCETASLTWTTIMYWNVNLLKENHWRFHWLPEKRGKKHDRKRQIKRDALSQEGIQKTQKHENKEKRVNRKSCSWVLSSSNSFQESCLSQREAYAISSSRSLGVVSWEW